jgi:hypothetical protein
MGRYGVPPDLRPPVKVVRYGQGELPVYWTPGDIAVVRALQGDSIDRLIRVRQRRTMTKANRPLADLDHMFCVTGEDGTIVEANQPGVQRKNGSEYRDQIFWVITPQTTQVQRNLCVAFWNEQVGDSYDVLDFVATQAPIALWGADFSIHGDRAFICSGLGCTGWMKMVVQWSLPSESMTPADACQDLGVDLDIEPLPEDFWDRLLDWVTWPGHALARLFGKGARARK